MTPEERWAVSAYTILRAMAAPGIDIPAYYKAGMNKVLAVAPNMVVREGEKVLGEVALEVLTTT